MNEFIIGFGCGIVVAGTVWFVAAPVAKPKTVIFAVETKSGQPSAYIAVPGHLSPQQIRDHIAAESHAMGVVSRPFVAYWTEGEGKFVSVNAE